MAKKRESANGPAESSFRIYYKVLRRSPLTGKIVREAGPYDCKATSGLTAIDKAKAHVKALYGESIIPDDGSHDEELKRQGDARLIGKSNEFKVL